MRLIILSRKWITVGLVSFCLLIFGHPTWAQSSSGTGFVVHPDGYILTCNHVVEGAGKIEVVSSDSKRYVAEVVEADTYKDLALLKIPAQGLPYVTLGDSERARVLDSVIALGYPLGIGNEVAANEGKINAKRDSEKIPLFQIDAAVNPGNSGGPLVNDHGEVIGVVVAKLNAIKVLVLTGSIPEGINFAIPILYAKSLLKKAPEIKTPAKPAGKLSSPDIFEKVSPATVRILKYDLSENPQPINPLALKTITITLPNLLKNAKPLEMVLIPHGKFLMGSSAEEQQTAINEMTREFNKLGIENETISVFRSSILHEGPQHWVTLTKDFYIGKYEVTQAQWKAVMDSNPSKFSGKPNNPVEQVSWNDCQTFIQKLNQMGQGTFYLPTEAEWEYACRAGTTTRFYWGDDPNYSQIGQYAWYIGNLSKQNHEVGTKLPNAWGLFDMSGNVREWCQDWDGAYSFSDRVDSIGHQSGSSRVLRGGCWSDDARFCRSAYRLRVYPSGRDDNIGLRVARTQ